MNLDINIPISSTNPCLIIYLLDQSGSMSESFGLGNHSKANQLAISINETILETGLKCIGASGDIKNRFELAVIGYGMDNKVNSAWEGNLQNKWVVPISAAFDNALINESDSPYWITSKHGQATPMKLAFENAYRLCEDWINWGNHKDCHPPIIINITDGEATDGGYNNNYLKNIVQQIKTLKTNHGNVNIMNIHISSTVSDKILFPSEINFNDKNAHLLYELSTDLTSNMRRIASSLGYKIEVNSKAYIYNGSPTDLLKFLNIGTPQ